MKALTQIMVQIVATLLLSPTSTLAGPGYVDLEVCSQLLSHRQGGLLDNLLGEQSLFLPVRSLRRSLHIDHGPYLYQKEKYSLEEILEQEQQRKIMIIESLNELQKMSQLTPVQKMAFYSAIEKIQIVEFHWATLNREKLAKLTLRDIQLRSPKLIYDQIIDSLRQYFARIRSLLAELEVALIVPDLTHVQKLIFEILPPEI
ncbi:MAG: hypothetical protein KDD40_12345, partial [Bdellovibrionales bacterium]|nr:hypothetical protein [Bdellovibrionales bacterium]